MRVSVIRVKRREGADGEVSRRETLVEGESLRIGRGLDVDVTIGDVDVDHHHATLSMQDGQPVLTSVVEGKLRVGRKFKRNYFMKAGEAATLGNHTVTLEAPPPHADLAIAIEPAPRAPAAAATRPQKLADALPSRRRLAWLLAAPVLAVLLIWPLAAILSDPIPPDDLVEVTPTSGDIVREMPTVVAVWTSGPMSRAHELIENDCSSCHLRPFEMTTNNACLACHADTGRHAELPFPAHGLDDARCGACHKEHNGGEKPIERASAACTVCHADPDEMLTIAPDTDLREVHDFGREHPPFRIAGGAPYVPDWVTSGGSEGLKFPHDVHMTGRVSAPLPISRAVLRDGPLPDGYARVDVGGADGARVRTPEGRLFTLEGRADLGCADCHVAEAGGALMRPVEMERDCAWCHQLKIDTLGRARSVPHAMEEEVVAIIRDYYRAVALEGGVAQDDAPAFARRRRGAAFNSESGAPDLSDASVQEAVAWSRAEADKHLVRVFNDEGVDAATGEATYDVGTGLCAYCHRAERQEGDEVRPWRVVPARLQRHWMPMARFEHGPHEAMECQACHEASVSKTSTDVLMPGIEGCRDCHKGEGGEQGAASECLACHIFHNEDYGPTSPAHAAILTRQMWDAERAPPPEDGPTAALEAGR